MKKIFLALSVIAIAVSCKKEPKDPEPTPAPAPTVGNLTLEFDPFVGSSSIIFNSHDYVNANSDTFNVTMFKHYVSNIVLTKSDNSEYVVPNSYFIVDYKTSGANLVNLSNIPVGNYKAVKFLLGVDSLRNVSGAQEGALAASNGMFWNWNTGYIFMKMEGYSPQSTNTGKMLAFHIGGFSGSNNALKTISIGFGNETANVNGTNTPRVHMKSDLLKMFEGQHSISFSAMNKIMMPGTNAKKIADNYANMFTFEHVHN
jgi:hypothetical protein